ncbi:MAG: restriction endonuclease subunit S [Saprospiraceae bacterium]
MEKKKTMTPKLRFPEFEGDWEEKRLGELGKLISGLNGKSGEDFGKGRLYVTYKQVFDNSIIDFKKCGKVYIGENENQNILQKGDILFTASSETPDEVGFASVVIEQPKEATYLNSFCFALRPFDTKENFPEFFRYLFHSPLYRKSVAALAQGITRYNISKGAFLNLKLSIPNLNEQQKIAATLTSLDDLLAAQAEKVKALQAHKKGLMQQLFPAEGERVPRVRFPEFEGEWEEKRLGEVGEFTGGGTPSKSSQQYWEGNIPWISSSDISEDSIHQFSISRFITKEALEQSATKLVPANSILLVSRVGVGKLAVSNTEVCTSQDFTNFTPDSDNLIFMAYLLKYESKTLIKICQGMAIKGFTKEDISKLNLFLPSKPEQQKIAALLTSLDDLITVHNQKLEVLKAHKKGLMQQMFPASHQEAL